MHLVYLNDLTARTSKSKACRHQSQNSSRGRICPYPTIGDMAVNCFLGEMDQIATCLKFPLNLHDHHISGVVVLLLLLLPLNCDEGDDVCMDLVMNGLQFFGVLLLDLLLRDIFRVFLIGEGKRILASKSSFPTAARGALGVIVARVTLVAFGGAKRANRATVAAVTALGGWGGSNPLIFSTSWRTCICSVLFFDSSSEDPFAIIAAGIVTLMSGKCGSHTPKKNWLPLQHVNQHDTPFSLLTFSASKHKKRGAQSGLWWAKRIKCTVTPL
jgi:hypothetical protein